MILGSLGGYSVRPWRLRVPLRGAGRAIGSLAAALHAGLGRVVVGIEISATHHRSASDGEVTAVATLAHRGRTLATYEIVITDTAGRRVCTSRLTCLIRDQVPGREANGVYPLREQGAIDS